MKKKAITRRKSLERIVELAAIAGGVHLLDFERLMAGVQQSGDLTKLTNVKTVYNEARLLKELLIPNREVFESEFGRKPIQDIFRDQIHGIVSCTINEDIMQSIFGHKDCPSLESCGNNTCGKQNCGSLSSCDENVCSGQSRIRDFDSNLVDLTATSTLERISSDPFITALYKELNVKSTTALKTNLEKQINLNIQNANKVKTDPRVERCAKVKALAPQAKLLKVTLMPVREIFYQEFGRWPNGYMDLNPVTGRGDCLAHLNAFGDYVIVDQGTCGDNTCDGQSCSTLTGCDDNGCNSQSCGGLSSCGNNGPLLNQGNIDSIKSDPFVTALFREFNTNSSATLSNELKKVLGVSAWQMSPNQQLQTSPQLQNKTINEQPVKKLKKNPGN